MAIVSPPPELMTSVANDLLQAAADLGYPAAVVATTSDGALGLGFTVPDDVAELALAGPPEAALALAEQVAEETGVMPVILEVEGELPDGPVVLAPLEDPEPVQEPQDVPVAPVKRGPGRPRKTEGSEVQ